MVVDGWDRKWGTSLPLRLFHYGFVPDASFYYPATSTREYSLTGVWFRPVHDIKCVNGVCRLVYDGEEHGMFRFSSVSMFGQETFRLFDQEKLHSR